MEESISESRTRDEGIRWGVLEEVRSVMECRKDVVVPLKSFRWENDVSLGVQPDVRREAATRRRREKE